MRPPPARPSGRNSPRLPAGARARPRARGRNLAGRRLALLVGQRRLLQPREYRRPVGSPREPPELVYECAEVAPAALVRLAVAVDEPLGARELHGQRVTGNCLPLDRGQPRFDARVLLFIAQRPPAPTLEARHRIEKQEAAHRTGPDLLAARPPAKPPGHARRAQHPRPDPRRQGAGELLNARSHELRDAKELPGLGADLLAYPLEARRARL